MPQAVPGALQLGKGARILYSILPSGEVVLIRAAGPKADDPLLDQFLGFLVCDMASHPERLQAVDARLVQRLQSLDGGIDVDLDSPLPAHVV